MAVRNVSDTQLITFLYRGLDLPRVTQNTAQEFLPLPFKERKTWDKILL